MAKSDSEALLADDFGSGGFSRRKATCPTSRVVLSYQMLDPLACKMAL